MRFTSEDVRQIEEHGLSVQKVEEQVRIFKRGNIPINIEAAATVGNGIIQYDEKDRRGFAQIYEQEKASLDILKFVPASGAATRMFKALHVFLDKFNPQKETLDEYIHTSGDKALVNFFQKIEDLPFYKAAVNYARECQPGFDSLTEDARKYVLVQSMLFSPGLNLSNYPKGLVPFHNYDSHVATAFEEHLYEAADYAAVKGVAKLHFTISPEHKSKFEAEYDRIIPRVEEKTNTRFEISFSFQDPATDTIAVDANNEPFRTEDGRLFFRPGGHGALIENLNKQNADVVFIKNIDNVVVADKAEEVAAYKKVLAGKLLDLQSRSFDYLKKLNSEEVSTSLIEEVSKFIEKDLFSQFSQEFEALSPEEKVQKLKDKLNRPIRVCGMVRNEGEPGGGPFLQNMKDGSRSLQIIESAQIDDKDPKQKEIALNATHFNPVDIICGLRDFRGGKFHLPEYVDPETSFIAEKTKDGKPLKALELPGLWNGAMSKWNTIFVEVPVSTFNPVKVVADLLKPSHQVK